MYSNADSTLYHKTQNGYTTTYFARSFWQDINSVSTGRDGQIHTSGIKLIIPTTKPIDVGKDDFFVKGKGAVIDNTSEATQSTSIKALGKIHSVQSFSEKLYGSADMQHYEFNLR